jgi:hypothetical protein
MVSLIYNEFKRVAYLFKIHFNIIFTTKYTVFMWSLPFIRFPAGARDSSSQLPRADWFWGPPSLLANGYGALSPRVKRPRREADHLPPSNAEVQKEWSYTFTLPSPPSWCSANKCPGNITLPLPFRFSDQNFVCIFHFFHVLHVLRISSFLNYHTKNIWWRT